MMCTPTATPREHIEEIRRSRFSIGGEPNPLIEDLHHAVNYLSAELYTKDVHFLMELIQNAEDNEYLEGVHPSLEFVITSQDITDTGTSATLLIFNNERGFSPKNVESICSVGRSTKKGHRKRGYIGEKGIGFKSVFLITARPYIFSNGYQIRFNEEPCLHCNLGYIVPEWVEGNPTVSVIKQIYGCKDNLPTTTLVLPLKHDKVNSVKQQLSSIHPEVLLFLSKIRRLSVREDNEDPRLNTVKAVSISKETNFITRKNIDAESYMLHLSTDEKGDHLERECGYHMWRQRFPVKNENKVERRMDVEEWVITLAFPFGERLNRGTDSPGIYAFLPTEMITNLPFIIQADFLLASSRETILLDNKWNQGILDCVPSAFVNAFTSLVKGIGDAPVSSLPHMFGFLPVNSSSYGKLNAVRDSIKSKLMDENIIPCESYTAQKFFHKPGEVGRLSPTFWNLLHKAREQGVSLHNISSHGTYIISSSMDREMYDQILNFLEVEHVDAEWYVKCIQSSNLVMGVSEDVYLDLLLFLADNWCSHFQKTDIKSIPLLKYVGVDRNVSLCSLNAVLSLNQKLLLSTESGGISWLISWNTEFKCVADQFFLPESTQVAIWICSKRQTLMEWLQNKVKVSSVNVYGYASLLTKSLNDRKLVVTYSHFLYHSLAKRYLSDRDIRELCKSMPLVDNYGLVASRRNGVLVPARGSKWLELIGSNPWRNSGYVELGEDYLYSGIYAGLVTPEKQLIGFLKKHAAASDLPDLSPPNDTIPSVYSLLTKQNALLLLDWIHNLRRMGTCIPNKFLTCIKEGSWLKISLNGNSGCRPPSQSFLLSSSCGHLLQNGPILVDIPLIDQGFYGNEINGYKDELKEVGVMFEYEEACQYIGKHLMSLAASSTLTRENVFSILKFIKFLTDKFLSPENFICRIQEGRWLRTSRGVASPVGAVLFDKDWKAASQISDIPFIDQDYYGVDILSFERELMLLGVLVGFNGNYQIVVNNLKSPACHGLLSAEAFLLMLECLRYLESSSKPASVLKDRKCIKTKMGPRSSSECFLFHPEWGCLLQVFNSFPLVDENFYGADIFSYKNELEKIGVVVKFSEATKAFSRIFGQRALLGSVGKEEVLSLLECCRKLEGKRYKLPKDLKECILNLKWMRTCLDDYRLPKECILFTPEWESISSISQLPFIDDSNNYYGKKIHQYKKELKSMGVTVDFKNGASYVITGLRLPQRPTSITPASVYSLLKCIQNFQEERNELLPPEFLRRASKNWLKTSHGYRAPNKCLLFTSDWGPHLRREDGPFIDERFYGSDIASYKKELNALGVTVDVKNGAPLVSSCLDAHSCLTNICRIYTYLNKFNWEPDDESDKKVWIPKGSDDGEWVSPGECVLHDKENLFGQQLNILDKYYDKKLLNFFSTVFGVKMHPSLDNYCKLWRVWENSGHGLSNTQCCAFWGFVARNWSSNTEKILSENLFKVPVKSGSDAIMLCYKHDVFIADELYLKDLLEQTHPQSLFVWYPQPSLQQLPRTKLLHIYSKIGVNNLSESVHKQEISFRDGVGFEQVDARDFFIRKGLFKIVLAFLADSSLKLETEKRLDIARELLDITICEAVEPIRVGYSLTLSSGEILSVEACRLIRWDRDNSLLLMQKMDRSGGQKNLLEYATYFSKVVAEGLLWEHEDHIHHLAELIKLGFLVEFDEEAIDFLLNSNNLQVFLEDEEFLSSAFPFV